MSAVHTTHTLEIEVELTGTYHPARPASGGSRFEPPTDPPEPEMVEDIDISSLWVERIERKLTGGVFQTHRRNFDLLKGLDKAAREVLISNILEAMRSEAEEALMEVAHG